MVTYKRGASGSAGGHRREYHSDPPATAGLLQAQAEFERLTRQVYVGVRDGVVDSEAAFDLACLLMEWDQPDQTVQELAELAAEGTDRERIAELARQVLASRFEPGFDLEPGQLAALEEALESVRSDMRATGLPGPIRLVVLGRPPHAFVEFRGGGYGSTTGIAPADGSDAVWALVAVADETQDSVMETLWETWPVCPAHNLGAHAEAHEGKAVWWCKGHRGHVITAIGMWNKGPIA